MNLNLGDVTPMTSATIVYGDTRSGMVKVTYKAKSKHHLVFIFLGDEPGDGSASLDLEDRMRKLGWVRSE